MIIMKTYCYKLYASKRNNKLHRQIALAGMIYNHCIALHKRYYRLFKRQLNRFVLQKHLVKLKKREKYADWNLVPSQAIQDITDRIDRAYKLFFENLKRKVKAAPPSFKKVGKYKSITLKQAGYKFLDNNTIRFGKQNYRFFKSREIEGPIKTVTIKRDALGDIYIYVVCHVEQNKVLARTGKSVGFDFGLKTFMTASDGNDIEAPLFFRKNADAIARANRALARKKKDSNNRRKAKLSLERLHKRIANQRRNFHWKTANSLVGEYADICIEDLNLKALQKLYGRKINDLGFANFIRILEYKAMKTGSMVIKIDRFYASSQECSSCGFKNYETKDLRVRRWTCSNCGETHDRDRNAAINILFEGMQLHTVA